MARSSKKHFVKNEDFLSQIPEWEKEYKESDKKYIDFSKADWKKAPAIFTETKLEILGQAVMEEWETPYMKQLAQIASSKGGVVLEIGYGMGISSRFIQEANIQKHIIIEANKQVANKARVFAKKVARPVKVLEGLWEEVINKVTDDSINGILFDSYPLTEEELYQNHFSFFKVAYQKLKLGGGTYILLGRDKNLFKSAYEETYRSGIQKRQYQRESCKG